MSDNTPASALEALRDAWTSHRGRLADIIRGLTPAAPVETPADQLARCSHCGSPNVQVSAWVNANTNEVISDEGPGDDFWCEDCESDSDAARCIYHGHSLYPELMAKWQNRVRGKGEGE